jgi:hypothetical protein
MTKLKTFITALLIGTSSMATVAAAQPSSAVYEVGSRDHRTYSNYDDYGYGVNVDARFDARFGWNDGREIDPGYVRRYPAPQPVYTEPTPGIACAPDGQPWAALTDTVDATGDRQFIHLSGAPLGALRLEMQRGSAYVIQIGVIFHNKRTTKLMVNRWMRAGDASDVLDFGRLRNVDGLVVYTADGGRGTYQIIGA